MKIEKKTNQNQIQSEKTKFTRRYSKWSTKRKVSVVLVGTVNEMHIEMYPFYKISISNTHTNLLPIMVYATMSQYCIYRECEKKGKNAKQPPTNVKTKTRASFTLQFCWRRQIQSTLSKLFEFHFFISHFL